MRIIALDARRLASRKFQDETTVVDLRQRAVHTMNTTASHLWEQISRGASFEELVQSLCETFDIEAEAAEKDVAAFVHSLELAGLVKTA